MMKDIAKGLIFKEFSILFLCVVFFVFVFLNLVFTPRKWLESRMCLIYVENPKHSFACVSEK